MADSSVLHKVVWPYELVYTTARKPAQYEDISIPLFVSGYLAVMVAEKLALHLLMAQHLHEVMGMQSCMAGSLSGLFMPYGFSNWSKTESFGLMKMPR